MQSILFMLLVGWFTLAMAICSAAEPPQVQTTAIHGTLGWAANTPGGRGGQILRVTNLNAPGPGSLREALEADGRRIIVFEVAGLIDLDKRSLGISNPYVTVHSDARRDSTAPTRPARRSRCGQEERMGSGRHSDWQLCPRRPHRPLLRQLGDGREPVRIRRTFPRRLGRAMAGRHFAPGDHQPLHYR